MSGKNAYEDWRTAVKKDIEEGKLNRADQRQAWRQDRKYMGERHLSFAEWKSEILFKQPEEVSQ